MSSAILSAKEQQVIDSTFPCHCPRCHQERLRFVLLENGAVCAQCWNETHPVHGELLFRQARWHATLLHPFSLGY